MRTAVAILSDFDSPTSATPPPNGVDSTTNSVRDRLVMEALLDIRDELVEMGTLIGECKDELVEIKTNTES